ncbi:MAG: HlyD family efflux transporter periplasmic adaptor subunit [Acidobacteria bacterium]|nr:HlyD family efflux transporter periplasmic adaptor subunit [Acidobacteriota bacterium]
MRQGWIERAPRIVRQRPRETGAVTVAVLVLLIGVLSLVPKRQAVRWPTAVAARERFTETLVEIGSISAARLMVYSSTVPGTQAKIVELAPEGASVAPGDLLVRFETAGFEQNLARENAALRQAESEVRSAREELRLEQLRGGAEVERARQQIGYAESALTDELEGRGRLRVAEAEAAAAEAAREAARQQTAYEDMRPLFAEGFVTRAELDRAEQAAARAAEQKRLADLSREAVVNYERPAAADRSRRELDAARDGLARQTEAAASQTAQRQAAAALARSRVEEIEARIAILQQQIAGSTIRADVPGLVVYRDLFFGTDRRKPQVGDEVWPNQPLIALPDTTQLTVETRVREVDLHRLGATARVRVKVEAYPELELPGTIALIGALAQDDGARAGTKFFPVTVRIDGRDERLRTGMTATVEIEVASLADAVVVPAQAVFDRGAQPYCYVLRHGRPVQQRVAIAGDNELSAAIASGIDPGDVVLLVDPAAGEAQDR